jgi:hypothetical protein
MFGIHSNGLMGSIGGNDAVGRKPSVRTNLLKEEMIPMHALLTPHAKRQLPRTNLVTAGAAAVMAAFVVALSLPAGAAATPTLTLPVSVSGLKSGEVESLLASTPLEDLSAAQLAKPISELPGFGSLLGILPSGLLQQALTQTIKELAGKGDTLEQLNSSSAVVSELNAQLEKIIPEPLLSLLPVLLKGNSLSGVLTSGLGSLSPSQLVEGLLTGASEPEREQLIENILTAVAPELQSLLGSTLAGKSFETSNVNELASTVGMTTEGFDSDLDATTEQILPTAMAVTTPLTNGKALAALEGIDGLHLGLLDGAPENTSGGSGGGAGGSGGAGGGSGGSPGGTGGNPGGPGGSGGTGGGGSTTPSSTTILVEDRSAQKAATTSAAQTAKVKILSRKVKGDAVTLVVQVPAAGSLLLAGKGVRSVREQSDGAERLTLRALLTKAGVASLRKHRHGLTVKLGVSFRQVNGSSSSATTTVGFG